MVGMGEGVEAPFQFLDLGAGMAYNVDGLGRVNVRIVDD